MTAESPESPSPESPEPLVCSAKGCDGPATTALRWNNPKIHTPERRKTWLACDEHRESLRAVPVGAQLPARHRDRSTLGRR